MADIRIRAMEVGPLCTGCYAIWGPTSTTAVVIDPGGDSQDIARCLTTEGVDLALILLTHSHYDHIGGVEDLLKAYPKATLACHAECGRRIQDPILNLSAPVMGVGGRVRAPDRELAHDELISSSGVTFHALHVPGHAPGHMVYHITEAQMLFSGDVLFAGGIGRTDLPDGDHALLMRGLQGLLEDLPPETKVYPGHGPATTLRNERKHNPFL